MAIRRIASAFDDLNAFRARFREIRCLKLRRFRRLATKRRNPRCARAAIRAGLFAMIFDPSYHEEVVALISLGGMGNIPFPVKGDVAKALLPPRRRNSVLAIGKIGT